MHCWEFSNVDFDALLSSTGVQVALCKLASVCIALGPHTWEVLKV